MRIHDARLGRFLSIDPLQKQYPWLTPYQFASNTPIQAIDIDGKEGETYLETKIENGKEIILRRVVELDVYVAISRVEGGTDYYSKNPKADENFKKNFNNDLAKRYKSGKFIDKDGNLVVFKFNVQVFDVAQTSADDFKKQLRDNETGVLKDAENLPLGTRSVVIQQTHMNDINTPKGEGVVPGGDLGTFTNPSSIKINDQQYDKLDKDEPSYTKAHEIAHFLLSKHPNLDIKNMGDNAAKHDMAGGGILHYYSHEFSITHQVIGGGDIITMSTPGRQDVNQANVTEFLKLVVDTGKRVAAPNPSNNH